MKITAIKYTKGEIIGNLIFLEDVSYKRIRKAKFLCNCGNTFICNIQDVKRGKTQSCGCFNLQRIKESHTIHGGTTNPLLKNLYQTWAGMKRRCNDPNQKHYGGKGITVCEKWQKFEGFLEDMGLKPFKGAELDRKDNSLGYCKENCRWVNNKTQNRNKTNSKIITYNNESKTVAEWAELLNMDYSVLFSRLDRGWSVEKSIETSKRNSRQIALKVKESTLDGKFIKIWDSAKEAATYYNIHVSGISECCQGKKKRCNNKKWEYIPTLEAQEKEFI